MPAREGITNGTTFLTNMTNTARKPSLATRIRDLVAGDGGFTLLETLAVMVIVGLLAAITVPQISKWREKAYDTSLKTDARNVGNAVEAEYVDNSRYPSQGEFAAMVTDGGLKLSAGNSIDPTTYQLSNESFTFMITSTKTDKFATYSNTSNPVVTVR